MAGAAHWRIGLITIVSMAVSAAVAQEIRSVDLIKRARHATPDPAAGQRLYAEHCAICHGAGANGNAGEVIPSLAAQLPVYLIKQLVDFSEDERESANMHRVAARKALSTPQALSDVAGYLGQLAPNPRPEMGDGTKLALGKRRYQELCAFCHGSQGEGNEAHATPALRRQHYSYLMMQTRELSMQHRYAVNPEIIDLLQRLSYDDLTAIADYTSRLPAGNITAARSEPASAAPRP